MEYAGMCITPLEAYSRDADVDNALKSTKNKGILSEFVMYTVRKAKRHAGPQHKGDGKFRHPYK
jgi:hypothetical protein